MVGATLADFYGVITAVPIAAHHQGIVCWFQLALATTGSGTNPGDNSPADGMEMGARQLGALWDEIQNVNDLKQVRTRY